MAKFSVQELSIPKPNFVSPKRSFENRKGVVKEFVLIGKFRSFLRFKCCVKKLMEINYICCVQSSFPIQKTLNIVLHFKCEVIFDDLRGYLHEILVVRNEIFSVRSLVNLHNCLHHITRNKTHCFIVVILTDMEFHFGWQTLCNQCSDLK